MKTQGITGRGAKNVGDHPTTDIVVRVVGIVPVTDGATGVVNVVGP
jgi:hypothetical protein